MKEPGNWEMQGRPMASSFSPQILMLKMVAAINEEPNGWVPGIRTVHTRGVIYII